MRIGIDTGGTFTDVAVWRRPGTITVHKLPSTPDDPARAVLEGLAAVRGDDEVDVVHGSTVGLNAVLTGRLARTALITNRGFEDLIEIGRQTRSGLYDLRPTRPEPPVPRRLRFGVSTRRAADGTLLSQATAAELTELRAKLAQARVEAVAIGLLHSFAWPDDEQRIARALRDLRVPITCSAELAPIAGEFERFCTAVLNAAMVPVVGGYLQRLERGVRPGRLRLMRSSGGILPAAEAARFPARATFSGPAGGVLATRRVAAALELGTVAALDMGGTSTDVCLVGSEATPREGGRIAGLPLLAPTVDLHTIGCGGGSIAYCDAGGALRVGPISAGADPGPACYGNGELPTVTDAHMVLGHLGAETLLGGAFPVDPALSVQAIERLARRLGLSLRQAAEGILEVAEVAMMRALLVITVERSIDPATVPLVAFGGAGGLHAARLAARLQMPIAVVPPDPGAFSAVGLSLAGESHEVRRPVLEPLADLAPARITTWARELTSEARAAVRKETKRGRMDHRVVAVLRFAGQGDAVPVPIERDLAAAFRAEHQRRFGFVPADTDIELVALLARAEAAGPPLVRRPASHEPPMRSTPGRRRPPAGGSEWRVYRREELPADTDLKGPCTIEEATGAVLVPDGVVCQVCPEALVLRRRGNPAGHRQW